MTVTTFQQENLVNPTDLIMKSLFVLVFKSDNITTYLRLKIHYDADRLLYLHGALKDSNHLFISLINPVEYTFVAKRLVQPVNREGVDKDFDKVDTNVLLHYLTSLNIVSTTLALN